MDFIDWEEKAKRLLKSELLKRGITNDQLVILLERVGVEETKAAIDSKISRGTFSAAFLIQCLNAIGCRNFSPDIESLIINEPIVYYKPKKKHERS